VCVCAEQPLAEVIWDEVIWDIPTLNVTAVERELQAEGERLARITGCTGCHGPTMAARVFILIPNVARLIAPYLTTLGAESTIPI